MNDLEDFEFDQTQRLISVESFEPGIRKILVVSFEGVEELSTLSRFRLEILSKGRTLKPSEILGEKLGVAIRFREQVRTFHGIVSHFEILRSSLRGYHLHLVELVPPAWLLTLNQKYRIFTQAKSPDIIQQVLNDSGFSYVPKDVGDEREYWVQYAESDFNFVSRLWEEEGLFYRFDHSSPECTLIVGDASSDYTKGTPETLEMSDADDSFQAQYRIGPSSFKHASWDFKTVSLVEAEVNGLPKAQPSGLSPRDVYEYPGRHENDGEASRLAKARMEEQESGFVCIAGAGSECMIETGAKYKVGGQIVELPAAGQTSDTYVVLRVEHQARDFGLTEFEGGSDYSNTFVCMPADLQFRPPRVTPRPFIRGPQTAIVVDTPDEYGRAKVKFNWDESETSFWVRVAQNWAFNTMGTQFFARIGSEVVVEFLNGDPDHPIIVGMVYNGNNMPPFAVPGNKTQSGIRGANWGDAGTEDVSNELRFEDDSGKEEIYLHAQKDFRRVVQHNDTLTVQTGDRAIDIQQGNHSLNVDLGATSSTAEQSITLTVGSSSITIDQTGITIKAMMISIEGQVQVDIKGLMTSVNADAMLKLVGAITMIN